MTSYVLGFCFSPSLQVVLLVRKTHPEWQAGRLNGLGGHVEEGETPEQAMEREFREETGGCDEVFDWRRFGRLRGEGFEVHLLCARFPHVPMPTHDGDEIVRSHHVDIVVGRGVSQGCDVIPNVRWIVPMALSYLRGDDVVFHDVEEIVVEVSS